MGLSSMLMERAQGSIMISLYSINFPTDVYAYIIEGLRLPIAWSMMKADPYP